MIEGALLHFKGIGKKKRELLYQRGIIDWETSIKYSESIPLNSNKKDEYIRFLDEHIQAEKEKNIGFFVKHFHSEDKWRILAKYFEDASFFDIETDGYFNRITTISLYHNGNLFNYTRNQNLEDFLDKLQELKLIVSFNGTSFDVPVVMQNFRIHEFPVPHLDLRWICYHEGIRGGLKEIEKILNIKRPGDLSGVDGMEAVLLWERWVRLNEQSSLEKLIKYCSADVLSLVKLSEKILSKKLKNFTAIDDGKIWELLDKNRSE